jgi:hypothetical protein
MPLNFEKQVLLPSAEEVALMMIQAEGKPAIIYIHIYMRTCDGCN